MSEKWGREKRGYEVEKFAMLYSIESRTGGNASLGAIPYFAIVLVMSVSYVILELWLDVLRVEAHWCGSLAALWPCSLASLT